MGRLFAMLLLCLAASALGPGEVATMDVRIRSKRGVSEKAAPTLARAARLAAARFPSDPAAQLVLTEAEFDAGYLDAAEAAADRMLAVQPRSVDALLYKGQIAAQRAAAAKADAATWTKVRGWYLKANAIGQDDPRR